MLKYNSINNFYTGDEWEKLTPLTSDYLNSIISQIEVNFNDIDERLEKIEKLFNENELNVLEATIKNGKIYNLESENLISNNANIEKITSNNIYSELCTLNNCSITQCNINNENVENSYIKNLNCNYSKINELHISDLKISDNYSLLSSNILFEGNIPGIKFNVSNNQKNGLSYYSSLNNCNAEITLENNSEKNIFKINFNTEKDDEFEIKSNYNLKLSAKNIFLEGNITPNNNNVGDENNTFDKIYSKQFFGSYFSYSADLAELYESDKDYEEGTILEVGFETEARIANGKRPILGVVSKKYAILLNEKQKNGIPIALKGRIYCKLSKKGERGDYIILDKNGFGKPVKNPKNNYVIGILIDPKNSIIKV